MPATPAKIGSEFERGLILTFGAGIGLKGGAKPNKIFELDSSSHISLKQNGLKQ